MIESSWIGAGGVPGLVAGVLLLLFGRRLYWLFVALAGFAFGFFLATRLFGAESGWGPLLVAVVVAAAAALVAVLFQKLAVAAAGFVAGGFLMLHALGELGHDESTWWIWVAAIAAGIAGALVTRWLFEAGLIVLSSLLGAALVLQSSTLPLGDSGETLAFFAMTAAGVLVQAFSARASRSGRAARSAPTA